MKKTKLSIITIAKNEQKVIEDCFKSAQWADEVILLDGGSTDETLKIATKYRVKVIPQKKTRELDYAAWHNQGMREAKGDWIFYLDADERISPLLKEEIKSSIINHQSSIIAFAIPRRNILLGKEMRFGGWYPDYQIRLFEKASLKRWEGKLHERPIFKGELGYLKQPMIHITHRDLTSMVEKTRKWSKIEAELLYKAGHPPVTWWRILRIMLTEFWQRGVKLQGWRDGTVGWIEIIYQMFSRFITYARLWEMQNEKSRDLRSIS